MNGAQKRTKHIWKGLRGKKYRYLTIAILCVSLIMAAQYVDALSGRAEGRAALSIRKL